MARQRVYTFCSVPAGGPYTGLDVTCDYPRYHGARDSDFRATPFNYAGFSNNQIRFRGSPLDPHVRRIRVDAVIESPGPAGQMTETWIK